MKLRVGAFFICLLLALAAVDTIPDPYALKPPTEHTAATVASHILRASPASLQNSCSLAARIFHVYQVKWLSHRFALDLLPQGDLPLPRVHHAADSSPPVVS